MSSKLAKSAAVVAAAAIAFSGAQGVASAEEGSLSSGSLGSTSTNPETHGSINTTDSLIGEPTLGSLAPAVSSIDSGSTETTLKIDNVNGALLIGGGLAAAAAAAVAVGVANGTIQLPEGFELPAGIQIPGL